MNDRTMGRERDGARRGAAVAAPGASRPRALSIVFRVAGGPQIGFGHVRRCWTLAQCLAAEGAAVTFVSGSAPAVPVLQAAGFAVTLESSRASLDATLRACQDEHADLCVVDDPRTSLPLLKALPQHTATVCI